MAQFKKNETGQRMNDDDEEVDLDQINRKSADEWRWYIIRSSNTIP